MQVRWFSCAARHASGRFGKSARMTMNMTELVPWDRRRAQVTDESHCNEDVGPLPAGAQQPTGRIPSNRG